MKKVRQTSSDESASHLQCPRRPSNPSKSGFWKFAQQSTKKMCGKSCVPVALSSCCVVFVTMIAIGIIHRNDCSGQPLLPIWLILMGLSAIIKTVIKMYYYIFQDGEREPYILRLFENLLDFGLFACFMAGCYLSIPAYLDPDRYVCDFFAVNLSFFFLLIYIVGSMAIACFCCSSAIYYIFTTPVQNYHSDRESPI